jgi:hypothetical protein
MKMSEVFFCFLVILLEILVIFNESKETNEFFQPFEVAAPDC